MHLRIATIRRLDISGAAFSSVHPFSPPQPNIFLAAVSKILQPRSLVRLFGKPLLSLDMSAHLTSCAVPLADTERYTTGAILATGRSVDLCYEIRDTHTQ